jgi:hypothetical protein
LIRGADITLPWETSGLPPTIISRSVRARSGIGTTYGEPYRKALAANRLLTSCEDAVYQCGEPIPSRKPFTHSVWL